MKRHLPFFPSLIFSAILLGIFGGFGIGAHIVYLLAINYSPGTTLGSMIQVHGHLQLFGWTGLFIIAVCLYKLPRLLSSSPLPNYLYSLLTTTLIGGLLLRSLSQLFFAYYPNEIYLRYAVTTGCLLESLGILLFLKELFFPVLKSSINPLALAAAGIKPFLVISFLGWFGYSLMNGVAGILFLSSTTQLLDSWWLNISSEIYIHLILLPTCFAFSISTLPIFLKLRAPSWPVKKISICYLIGTALYLIGLTLGSLHPLTTLGAALRIITVLWLVFELDFLRIRAPWYKKFRDNEDRENRPPRKHSSDYGQFGNFEWLIYTAYSWLCIAALYELFHLTVVNAQTVSITRHIYLLGFVTHLILGMAVRMIPGFLGKNRIAFPNLVRLSFVLIVSATIFRILPVAFNLTNQMIFRAAYGISGIVAILAICCLGINLAATIRKQKRSVQL